MDRKTTETQTGGALQKPTDASYHASRRDAGFAALVSLARIELDLHARDFPPQRFDFEAGSLRARQQLGAGSAFRPGREPRNLSVDVAVPRFRSVPSLDQLLLLLAP